MFGILRFLIKNLHLFFRTNLCLIVFLVAMLSPDVHNVKTRIYALVAKVTHFWMRELKHAISTFVDFKNKEFR